jgi:hypothetical protein
MTMRPGRALRSIPVVVGLAALAGVVVLFVRDILPELFPAVAHEVLAAFTLAAIAFAYLAYQAVLRPSIPDTLKAILLALAFLFWAANQLWPALPEATLFNDIAVGLFVLDIFLVMLGRPQATTDRSFAETELKSTERS